MKLLLHLLLLLLLLLMIYYFKLFLCNIIFLEDALLHAMVTVINKENDIDINSIHNNLMKNTKIENLPIQKEWTQAIDERIEKISKYNDNNNKQNSLSFLK